MEDRLNIGVGVRKPNTVVLSGKVSKPPEYSHQILNKNMYIFYISVLRLSGTEDILPIIINEEVLLNKILREGQSITVRGTLRSRNFPDEQKHMRLAVYVYCNTLLRELNGQPFINEVNLDCFLCKDPIIRKTADKKIIANLLVAIDVSNNKTVYTPVICWGNEALRASDYKKSDNVIISGRLQSRQYIKKIDRVETKFTTYEVSANRIYHTGRNNAYNLMML